MKKEEKREPVSTQYVMRSTIFNVPLFPNACSSVIYLGLVPAQPFIDSIPLS